MLTRAVQYDQSSDRQTDGQTDGSGRVSLVS